MLREQGGAGSVASLLWPTAAIPVGAPSTSSASRLGCGAFGARRDPPSFNSSPNTWGGVYIRSCLALLRQGDRVIPLQSEALCAAEAVSLRSGLSEASASLWGAREFDGAETGRRLVGEAPPPGPLGYPRGRLSVVRSKGLGEAVAQGPSALTGVVGWVGRGAPL